MENQSENQNSRAPGNR